MTSPTLLTAFKGIAAGLCASAFALTSLQAQDTAPLTVEQRLERMESEVKKLRQENQDLRSQLGVDGKTSGLISVKPAGKEPVLKLGGLVQAQGEMGDKGDSRFGTKNDRFYLRRARINASGSFLEDFDFRVELDLAGTLAETTGLRAQMTDGYVQWTKFDEANIRLGQFKTPFGFEQLYRDPYLYTIERSLANDRLTLSRQLGAQVSGDFFEKRLSYAAGLFNGNGVNNNFNDDDNFTYVGRISGTPWQGKLFKQDASWGIGASGYYSSDANVAGVNDFGFDLVPPIAVRDNIFAGTRRGMSLDTQFTFGRLELWAEYLRTHFNPLNSIPMREFDAEGWYVQGSYYIIPKKLQGVAKFETFNPNKGVAGDATDAWTFGVNYYLKGHDIKLQLDYLREEAAGISAAQDKILFRVQTIF